MEEQVIREFPITVYGNLTKYSDTISKGRCRIFYKYANRNGTYITDEFAEKLLSTIPYTPVKGIYDTFEEDYTDHGAKRNLGRIYGIVPENPNLQWEKHLDEDGVEREYACVDVLIFTALYEEAEEILGKAQSMEIYEPSINGNWEIINGRRMFKFTEGSFLGLQVLGEDVEPCFEGAAFFSLYNSLQQLINEIKEYTTKLPELNIGGQSKMFEKLNFKLSDNEKHDAIWSLINPNYNEEGGWMIEYAICDIYDDYALAYNYAEASYERVYYTKNDETNEVAINDRKKVFVIDVTENEMNALATIRTLNGGTYEKAEEVFAEAEKVSALEEEISTNSQKIEELNESISTLETEKGEFSNQLEEANNTIASLTAEVESLNTYKANIELKEKEAVISSYTELLSEEILDSYKEKISDFTAIDLDKELAYELKKNNVTVFSKNPNPGFIPKDEPKTGIEAILSKYKN
jgi:hypothetical protein